MKTVAVGGRLEKFGSWDMVFLKQPAMLTFKFAFYKRMESLFILFLSLLAPVNEYLTNWYSY